MDTNVQSQTLDDMKNLVEIGFKSVGAWGSSSSGLELRLHALEDASPALYAFVVRGDVKYVGKTTRPLQQRLYGYRKPGKSQLTNIRIRSKILEALRDIDVVEVLGFCDPRPRCVGRFRLNMAAALEDDIIKQLRPEWNSGGGPTRTPRPEAPRSAKDEAGR